LTYRHLRQFSPATGAYSARLPAIGNNSQSLVGID
jgi:hypothetical protein